MPTRALGLLMFIGFVDLIVTAVLHSRGLIDEMNPLMKTFIDRSEWSFAIVKALTLIAAWIGLAWYGRQNREYVRAACLIGSCLYCAIWVAWFFAGQ